MTEILFYGGFPLGFHNPEAERKALAFQQAGYRVHYAPGVGVRDPGLASIGKAANLVGARLRSARPTFPGRELACATSLEHRHLLVVPPRRVSLVRKFNGRWLERQIRGFLSAPEAAVVWIRYASPELVDVLPRLRPAVVVYEVCDAMHHTPGLEQPPWDRIFEDAERALTRASAAVVVPHAALGERYRTWGAEVRVIPHGVDVLDTGPRPRPARDPVVVGFVGTLDRRLDPEIIRAVAQAEPGWRIRLIGPVTEGFDPAQLADLANVEVRAPIPHAELGRTLAGFDLGLMPYFDHPMYRGMSPLKNLELLAAGVPAVARTSPALMPFRDVIGLADTPDAFVAELRHRLATDSPAAAAERRDRVRGQSWSANHAQLVALLNELGAPA